MAKEITHKQENFCLAYIETGNAAKAYRQSYDCQNMTAESIYQAAHELMQNPKITLKIRELKEPALKKHDITIDSLTKMHKDIYDKAIQIDSLSAAVAAANSLTKLHGLSYKDKSPTVTLGTLPKELTAMGEKILEKMAAGNLSPEDAAKLLGAVASHGKVIESDELIKRIESLEKGQSE